MFDKIIFKTTGIGKRENGFEVDRALAYCHHLSINGKVFYMQHTEAARMFFNIAEGIDPSIGYPEQIEFHIDKCRFSLGKQHVIGNDAIDYGNFKIMVVVSDFKTRLATSLTRSVERIDKPLVVIEWSLVFLQIRNDNIILAYPYCALNFTL